MPDPANYNSESEFMRACIPMVEGEGKTNREAVARCLSMWRNRKGKKFMIVPIDLGLDQLLFEQEKGDSDEIKFSISTESFELGTFIADESFEVCGIEIEKGEELHYTLGVVLEPETVDLTTTEKTEGDIYSAEEVEKAMFQFNMHHWNEGQDIQHSQRNRPDLVIIESYLAPVEMKFGDKQIKKGTWLMKTLYFNSKIWEAVKSGKLTGLSIEGRSHARAETLS